VTATLALLPPRDWPNHGAAAVFVSKYQHSGWGQRFALVMWLARRISRSRDAEKEEIVSLASCWRVSASALPGYSLN
jgi:hypothetical protein